MSPKVVPFPQRPTWDDPEWWQAVVASLPERECPRCGGYWYRRYWLMDRGRQAGYSCPVDGEEKVVWVQERFGDRPQLPDDGLWVRDTPEERNREVARARNRRARAKAKEARRVVAQSYE